MEKPVIKLNTLEKTAVNVPTQESYNELMRVFESGGWEGPDCELPSTFKIWGKHGEMTCIGAGVCMGDYKLGKFGYASKKSYLEEDWKIISNEDFYKKQPDITFEKRAEINAYFNWKEKQEKTN